VFNYLIIRRTTNLVARGVILVTHLHPARVVQPQGGARQKWRLVKNEHIILLLESKMTTLWNDIRWKANTYFYCETVKDFNIDNMWRPQERTFHSKRTPLSRAARWFFSDMTYINVLLTNLRLAKSSNKYNIHRSENCRNKNSRINYSSICSRQTKTRVPGFDEELRRLTWLTLTARWTSRRGLTSTPPSWWCTQSWGK